jgi:hypothetical protein
MAKAQRMPEGVTTVDEPEPVRVTRPAALLSVWAPICPKSIYDEPGKTFERKCKERELNRHQ